VSKKVFIDYFINISDDDKKEEEFARFCAHNFKNKSFSEKTLDDFCLLFPENYLGFKYKRNLKKFLKNREQDNGSEENKRLSG
jgi:hypothetical protein